MDKKTFIAQIAPAAQTGADRILASLTIAQAVLEGFKEDGSGLSELADSPNFNLFGIKGVGTKGSVELTTTEYDGAGNASHPVASFRKYNSWDESIADHLTLLTGASRYANLIGEKDFSRAAYLIYKDGYATDPNYTGLLQAIYNEYELGQYDKEDDCPEWARGARDLLMKYNITDGTRPNDQATRAEVWTLLNNLWYALEHQKEGESNG